MNFIHQLQCAIVKGDIQKAVALTEKCLREGLAPSMIIEKGILHGMEIVGDKWKTFEYFIPNVLISAIATKLSLGILQPVLNAEQPRFIGKALAGTVSGDVHDIGKNIGSVVNRRPGIMLSIPSLVYHSYASNPL